MDKTKINGELLTVEAAGKKAWDLHGVQPAETPNEDIMAAFLMTVRGVLDVITAAPRELKLLGVFLYDAAGQGLDVNKETWGITLYDTKGSGALIGIATETFLFTEPDYWPMVFLHQIAHLSNGINGHSEGFSQRYSRLLYEFYGRKTTAPAALLDYRM